MNGTVTQRLAVFLAALGLALCAAGWRTEADAWTAMVDAWFEIAWAEQTCPELETRLEAWQRDEQAGAEALTTALVERIEALDNLDELSAVEQQMQAHWDRVFSNEAGFERMRACVADDPLAMTRIDAFDAVATTPVTVALESTRARLNATETAAAGGANMELARVAAETFARTVTRYKDAIEYHADKGCEALAKAHTYWTANYYEVFDSSSATLSGEIQRMSDEEFATLEPLLARVETDRAAFDAVESCADSLQGDAATKLEAQRAQLAWIVQLVRVSRPL